MIFTSSSYGLICGGALTFPWEEIEEPLRLGISRLDASGSVYNLTRLEDFNGVYGQARTGWAAGKSGKGDMWVKNPNGVYLRLHAQRRGLALSIGADGLVINLV